MRTLFFGTSDFAVPSLRVTAEYTDLRGVVTQPDRPAGRGHRLQATPVKIAALELGLQIYEPANLRQFTETLSSEKGGFDCFILASYGRILPQAVLDIPKLGALNVHPSLLPKYRGATPIQTALLNGDTETGVSIMLMDAGMDTGDIVLQERIAIEPEDTYGTLHDRLAARGAQLLENVLSLPKAREPKVPAPNIASFAFPRTPQQGEATATRPISKEQLQIDWSWNARRIVNHVRAFSPQPAARTVLAGESIKLLHAHIGDEGPLKIQAGDGTFVTVDELIAPNRGRETGTAYIARRG